MCVISRVNASLRTVGAGARTAAGAISRWDQLMTLYNTVLFAHVTSVMVMFASLTADGLAVAGLRTADTVRPARAWVRALEVSARVGPRARLAVLGAGLYLAIDAWSWQGWIIVGLTGWTIFVVLGEPLTGHELREMRALVTAEPNAPSVDAMARLRQPRMWYSVLLRAGLGIGALFCMTVKPPVGVAVAAAVSGTVMGVVTARMSDRSHEQVSRRLDPNTGNAT
jgi:hypothetical protein